VLLTLDTFTMSHHLLANVGDYAPYLDSDGVEWVCTEETGWFGSAATKPMRTPRVTTDGVWRAANYRDIRTVGLVVAITAPSTVLMRRAQQEFMGMCPDPTLLYPLTVTDETGAYTAAVELDGAILSKDRNWNSLEFSVQLVAPDPRKFAATVSAISTPLFNPGSSGIDAGGSGISASAPGISAGFGGGPALVYPANPGTAPVGPVIEFLGPVDNPSVMDTVTGTQVTFTGTVDDGVSLYLNCDDQPQPTTGGLIIPGHAAVQAGTLSRRGQITLFGGWPVLPPGTVRPLVFYGTSAGAPTMTVHYRSAWR
jgi:hypothetical protein